MVISFSIFTFEAGNEEKVEKGLAEQLALVKQQGGCKKLFLARALDNPDKYLIYSEWSSREAYESSGEKLRLSKEGDKGIEGFLDLMTEVPILGSFEISE